MISAFRALCEGEGGDIGGHYNAVMMDSMASQITSITIVYSAVYSGADQRKHQSTSKLRVTGLCPRWIPRRNGQQRGKCFHLMTSSCLALTKASNSELWCFLCCSLEQFSCRWFEMPQGSHYNDVIMSAMASQITSLTVVLANRLFRRKSKKTSKLRVTGFCAGNSPVAGEFPHKGPVTRKMFPFDDFIMMRPWCKFWQYAPFELVQGDVSIERHRLTTIDVPIKR